ncbi:Ig-like domain-containing protein [Psychrobium sp. nBUS_13]|uniref:Ig-like domain-containing protein n=1 Tax=Psychrobium sp. nBUS_13 TaxID=3395319 RepID=UPI003EB69ABA
MNKLFRLVPIAAAIATLTACGGSSSNEAPKFNIPSNTITLAEDGSFSQIYTATDKENDNISYSLSSAATNGAVTIDANTGALIYTPNSDFNGQDSFIIAAADEGGRTTQVFTVEVTAINDIPVIDGDSVIFSGVETKKGMLSATDIDGDTLTYSIETEPKNGTLTVDSASGELTYIVTKLDQSSDSFVIGVTDSNSDKVMKEIAIRTSLASNDDRAYYYYSSPESHLQQAQTVADSLNNDQVKASVYSSLVSGYANAGFDNQVEQLLDPQEILSKETRVYAIMSAARANVRRGSNELATEYLVQAQNLYNEVLATNGIGTLNYAVFEEIYDLYNAMGDLKGQSQTYSLLDLLMNSLPDGVESRRMFFAYDRAVKDAVAHWQKTGNEENRLYAKSMAERSIKLIPKIGYATNRNGEQFSSVTLVAYEYLIRELYDLNEIELAKQALATALSLYGYVDYDENHKVAADQYAENTRNEFAWVASGFAAQYIKLYPEADSELLKEHR